jgi:hypothetical protein
MSELLDNINKVYFWDIDPANLDEVKSKRIIIERVMNFGNLQEIKLVKDYYGVSEITNILCSLNYIDPKTLNFISILFHIPKTKFKCFSKKQLIRQPWNY